MEITKKDFQQFKEEIKTQNKKNLDDIMIKNKQSHEEYKRSFNVIYEKFRSDVKIIGEGWQMNAEKTNATFELASEMKEDIEIIKMDISFIKNALKQKADKEEVEALEKRVILLENKLRRV